MKGRTHWINKKPFLLILLKKNLYVKLSLGLVLWKKWLKQTSFSR